MTKLLMPTGLLFCAIVACSTVRGGSDVDRLASSVSKPTATLANSQRIGMTRLYNENCANCHGEKGEGGGAGTKTLLTTDKFDQKHDLPFFNAIKNGVTEMGMRPFAETLTDEQIWGLVVHIRELQQRALRYTTGSFRPDQRGGYVTSKHNYRVETVIGNGAGLTTPWALDWLPDGVMLVTNRPGFMVAKVKDQLYRIGGLPSVLELGQGGLMEVTVHPDYAKNGWVYLAYTEPRQTNPRQGMTKIVRGKLSFSGSAVNWHSQQTIFEVDQEFYTGAGVHFGSRIVFDRKGKVFFIVGERGGNMLAQDVNNPFGKVYRLNEDGSVPKDNPYATRTEKRHIPGIWSLGHRNPQGMVFDLEGNLWVTEHGPRGGDELNLVEKGKNYGWPVISFGIDYSDGPFRTPWAKQGQDFTMPVYRWIPSIGACGLDVYEGSAFPNWKGDLLAGGLSGANVDRIKVREGKLIEREEILRNMGRVRDVITGPDGLIYVILNGPDQVIRLTPR